MHRKPYNIGDWAALLTLGVATALLLALLSTYFLNNIWNYLTHDIDHDAAIARSSALSAIVATISLFAATVAAIAAIWSLRHNQDISRRELRAYMSARSTTIHHIIDNKKPPRATAIVFVTEWENVGGTPARRIVSDGGRAILPTDIPDNFDYGRIAFDGYFSETGPASQLQATVEVEVSDIKNPNYGGRLFIWAAVEYSDVFQNTPRHRTEVCHEVVFHGDPASPNTRITMRHRGGFNGSDEDCRYPPTPVAELRNKSAAKI